MRISNISNTIANTCDLLKQTILSSISTAFMKLNLRIRNISYGKSICFNGLAKFKRSNRGTICIGSYCILNSTSTSNLIGVNRPCIITALTPGSSLTIGDHCGFSGTVIGCFDKITIGNNVRCGANTLITDSNWHLDDPRAEKPKPITIEDNVWLGVNAVVLKGVHIGRNSVIGANSVVTKDIPSGVIAAGNPCKVIKQL
jgi:acetyltransferase-like isoleucine patch superfamily enzyme